MHEQPARLRQQLAALRQLLFQRAAPCLCSQRALLRAGDAQLLARWTASVHGRDDIAAWEAYLTTLDPHSTLFAQVRARIELLDRQLGI